MTPCEQCGCPSAQKHCRDCLEWAAIDRRLQAFADGIAQHQRQLYQQQHQRDHDAAQEAA